MLRFLRNFFRGNTEESRVSDVDWTAIVSLVLPHIESHSIFAVYDDDSWERIGSSSTELSDRVTRLAVAYDVDGINPWETEVPAKYMAQKLSAVLQADLPHFISRSADHFAGFYVDISARTASNIRLYGGDM